MGGLSSWSSLVSLTSFATLLQSPFTGLLLGRPRCCSASGFVNGVVFIVCFSENSPLGFREGNYFCQSCVLPCGWIGFLVLDVLSELLGISVIESYHLPTGIVLLYAFMHFLFLLPFFSGLSFSYYIELVKVDSHFLANLRENVLMFLIWYDMFIGLLYMAFVILRYNTYMPWFVQDFIIKDVKYFFCLYDIIVWLYTLFCSLLMYIKPS